MILWMGKYKEVDEPWRRKVRDPIGRYGVRSTTWNTLEVIMFTGDREGLKSKQKNCSQLHAGMIAVDVDMKRYELPNLFEGVAKQRWNRARSLGHGAAAHLQVRIAEADDDDEEEGVKEGDLQAFVYMVSCDGVARNYTASFDLFVGRFHGTDAATMQMRRGFRYGVDEDDAPFAVRPTVENRWEEANWGTKSLLSKSAIPRTVSSGGRAHISPNGFLIVQAVVDIRSATDVVVAPDEAAAAPALGDAGA